MNCAVSCVDQPVYPILVSSCFGRCPLFRLCFSFHFPFLILHASPTRASPYDWVTSSALTLTWNDELSNCLSLLVLSREFSGMIHNSNVIIPATPSNSISYVKRTSKSPFISAPAICHGHGGLFLAELGHPIAGAARCMGCRRGFLLARACPDGRGPRGPRAPGLPRPNGHRSPAVMVTGGRLNQQPGGRL